MDSRHKKEPTHLKEWELLRVYNKIKESGVQIRWGATWKALERVGGKEGLQETHSEATIVSNTLRREGRRLAPFEVELFTHFYPGEVILSCDVDREFSTLFTIYMESTKGAIDLQAIVDEILGGIG